MNAVAGEYGPRYEVLGEIAQGGTGVLLEVRDVDLGRLQHPGIVPVYDLGRESPPP